MTRDQEVQDFGAPEAAAAENAPAVLEAADVAVGADAAVVAGVVEAHAAADVDVDAGGAAATGPAGGAEVDKMAQRVEGKLEIACSCEAVEVEVAFEGHREIDAALVLQVQAEESVTAAEEPVEQGYWRKERCRSKESSERRRLGGCCEWHSVWGKMQRQELAQV